MREFLTGIAIILIVFLTTVLVAPYFVDWNGQRDFLEARLSHALGQKVTIGGAIDLKLLPTPYLVLGQVVVGGDEAPVRVGIHHLDLELAAAPLLHGEFDIVQARLEEPTIRLSLARDGTLPELPAAPAFSADVRFDRIQVADGTLALADPQSGRTFVLDHLDFDADAGSLTGPFKLSGAEGSAEHRTKFRLATAAAEHGRARTHLFVEETVDHPGLDLDGTVALEAADNALRQSFDGKLVLSGHLPRQSADPFPWKLSGPIQADPSQAALTGGELRLGKDEAGITLQADAHAAFGEKAKLDVQLAAKQLDIDRLAGAPADGAKSPPQLPDVADLKSMIAALTPPIPIDLAVSVEAATYAGETLSGLEAHVTLGDAATHPVKLAIEGPGGARLAMDGMLGGGVTPTYTGALDLSADELPRTLAWLHRIEPSASWVDDGQYLDQVRLAGPVELSTTALDSTSLALTLGRSQLEGSASLAFGGQDRPKLTADLKAAALDLDGLPSLETLTKTSSPVDLDLRIDAETVRVSGAGESLKTGHSRLVVATKGSAIDLRDLHVMDLGGATVEVTGRVGPDGGQLTATLDADKLAGAAGVLRHLAPGAVADAIAARAAALSPAKLKIDAALRRTGDGKLEPSRLSLSGTFGASHIDASSKPDPDQGDLSSISAQVRSPDGGALLRQLGLNAGPIETIGESRIDLSAKGRSGDGLKTKLDARFGDTKLHLDGRFDVLSSTQDGAGKFRLQSSDLTPLLQTLSIAYPDMAGRLPVDATGEMGVDRNTIAIDDLKGRFADVNSSGELRWHRGAAADAPQLTGTLSADHLRLSDMVELGLGPEQTIAEDAAWSRQPFAIGLVDPPRSALSLQLRSLDIVPGVTAHDAKLDLGIGQNIVAIERLAGDLSGGTLKGRAKLRRDGRQASIEGKLTLDHVHVRLHDTLHTDLTAALDFAGGGTSSLGLVSSLAGSGTATATKLDIAGGDPQALVKIFDDVEADVLAVDQDQVARAYRESATASLEAGTARFGLGLAAGIVHFEPQAEPEVAEKPVTSKLDASLDLPRARFQARIDETLRKLPKNWTGPPPSITTTLQGPVGEPTRSVDVGDFLNAVAARALARETARIEAYELDVRERAFFNARMQWDKRRQEERDKANADAERAETERAARVEAARQDRARRDAAAKAARDAVDKPTRDQTQDAPTNKSSAPDKQASPPADEPPRGADPSTLGRY